MSVDLKAAQKEALLAWQSGRLDTIQLGPVELVVNAEVPARYPPPNHFDGWADYTESRCALVTEQARVVIAPPEGDDRLDGAGS